MKSKIVKYIEERLDVGYKEYGKTADELIESGRDFTQDALEEILDLAVYISAKLIEIKQKEKIMGAKIELENKVDRIEARLKLVEDAKEKTMTDRIETRLKLVEDALEELVQTRVKHIDLADDEEFTLPVGRRKKTTTKRKTAKVD